MGLEDPSTPGTLGDARMSRESILDRLSAEAPGLKRKYGVTSLGGFGSMARGDDREGSDVDILVTFEGPATFRGFMGLKLDLEDLLGRPVDLGTPDTLRPEIRPGVEKDLIQVA
jgi:predicted nucleotidyltransferase